MSVRVLASVLNVPDDDVQKGIDAVKDIVDGIHYDVMDGRFVPPKSFSVSEFSKLHIPIFTEIHLMVQHPEEYVPEYAKAGAGMLTIHFEAQQKNVADTLALIKKHGCKAGLSIKPATLLEDVPDTLWNYCDSALIMSVEPGWGGQEFMEKVLDKVRALRRKYPDKDISIDGGINNISAPKAVKAGCSTLVCGSYLFRSGDYRKAVESLKL